MPVTINGSAGVTTNSGAVYNGLQTDTAKASTSGTSVDFTSIPSWVKRITVMFSGVSTNGTNVYLIQLGDSGGIETTGYVSQASATGGSGTTSTVGFICIGSSAASTNTTQGSMQISLLDSSANTWVASGAFNVAGTTPQAHVASGNKSLSATLDRLRVIGSTTGSPTDTFDAGTINIIYE